MKLDLGGTSARIAALENKVEGLAPVAESGSYADLTDLPVIQPGEVIVDTAMSDSSENVVQNKVIKAYVDANNAGYQFMGVATPSTNPGTPDQKVFYIAITAGTYTNFSSLVVNEGEVAILKYDTIWSKDLVSEGSGHYVSNLEYVRVIVDNDGKFLCGITSTGDIKFGVGVPSDIQAAITAKAAELNELLDDKVDKENGKSLINSDFANGISYVSNLEYIEAKTDKDGKIIEGMRANAEIVHYSKHKFLGGIDWTKDNISDLSRALKDSGFSSGTGDWSDNNSLKISEPRCAIVNISGIESMPQSKTSNLHSYLQFWDMQGNYFKKKAILNAQGSSTMSHPKKNIAIDLCNDEWVGDDTFSLQIGDWVAQDSFHLKAYYNDAFRCTGAVSYQLYDEIVKSRGELNDYVWKRALIDMSEITATSNGASSASETEDQFNTGAKCFPKGFPCIVYLNGDFYGIFSWQLKKHRDNMHQKKSNAKHIHLDGIIDGTTLFNANGNPALIDLNADTGFEIRNPKDLYLMDGTKYDADTNSGELIDSTSPNYDASNGKHIMTAEVKSHILALSEVMTTLSTAKAVYDASAKTDADKATFKAVFETHFDIPNIVDYLIFSDISNNYDGFRKNWQFFTYDGTKWFIGLYDCDCTWGGYWELTQYIYPTRHSHFDDYMMQYLPIFYEAELEARYTELRKNKILDTDHIVGIFVDWLDRIGNKETFSKEWEKWDGFIKNDSIHRVYKWVIESLEKMDSLYNFNN